MSMEALIEAEEIIKHFNDKADEIPDKLKELVNIVAFAVDREVKNEAPVITGNLQGATSIDNLSDFEKRVYVDEGVAPYALFVIAGTRPHDIRPKEKKALFWEGIPTVNKEGEPYPIIVAHHPGTKANDYFTRGIQKAETEKDSAVNDFLSWLKG